MDPRTVNRDRNMLPQVGPKFFRDGDAVMFEFVIDSGNVIGPREATRGDQAKHPTAWSAFVEAGGLDPLDRDGQGGIGGSLPVESQEVVPVEAAPEPPAFVVASEDEPEGVRPATEAEIAERFTPADEPAPKRKYTRRKVDA
jgi:hypothetical protein